MNASFFSLNTRGFNQICKHDNVKSWIVANKPMLCCLLETRVQEKNSQGIIKKIFPDWNFVTNYDHHRLGRIWIMWSDLVSISVFYKSPQIISADVQPIEGNIFVFLTVYALNFRHDRSVLWDEMGTISISLILILPVGLLWATLMLSFFLRTLLSPCWRSS